VATIKDIARTLRISTSTVSYALNGGPRPVPDEVRRRVLQVASELEYRPNRIAKSLVTGLCNVIGVVPPCVDADIFNSPFVRMTWNALVNEAEALQQDLLLFAGQNRNFPNQTGLEFLDGRIDGIIFIAPRSDTSAIHYLAGRRFPLATIASDEGDHLNYKVDNEGGVRLAMEHLYELGHRRIAHLAGYPSPDSEARESAFRRIAMEMPEAQVLTEYVERGDFTMSGGFHAGLRLLKLNPRPTAVFAGNDEMACGLIQALQSQGVSVPEEMSIVGFDDCDLCYAFNPPLTTIRQPVVAMASAAVRSVVSLVRQQEPTPATVFPTELVVRASTAPPQIPVPGVVS
jgi:LacI family transcriptional regulator